MKFDEAKASENSQRMRETTQLLMVQSEWPLFSLDSLRCFNHVAGHIDCSQKSENTTVRLAAGAAHGCCVGCFQKQGLMFDKKGIELWKPEGAAKRPHSKTG